MQALKDKRVQLSIVGLIVAAAAAYGVVVDEQALLAVVALLAAVAGGVAGRLAGAVEAQDVRERNIIKIWDEMEIGSAHIHNQAMDEPFIYPDTIAEADTAYDMAEMAEDIAILNQRMTAIEAKLVGG